MTSNPLVIEPGQKKTRYWWDLWEYRELFFFLTWRDVAVRYKQTLLGIGWAVFQPLISMIILTVVFGSIARLDDQTNVPYAFLVLTGILPWQLFTTILNAASNSLVASSRLFTKVYFPRLLIPISVVGVALVDFLISFALLLIMALGYLVFADGVLLISPRLLLLPVPIVFACITALSIAIWFATLNVKYRDFRIIMPFVVQFGVFLTPVGYSSSVVERFPLLLILNPMAQIIDGFRWVLLGQESNLDPYKLTVSFCMVGLILWSGILYFRRVEDRLADVV
ncbi:MAG: ABC transporter permease [Sumerlaeia bacterium]